MAPCNYKQNVTSRRGMWWCSLFVFGGVCSSRAAPADEDNWGSPKHQVFLVRVSPEVKQSRDTGAKLADGPQFPSASQRFIFLIAKDYEGELLSIPVHSASPAYPALLIYPVGLLVIAPCILRRPVCVSDAALASTSCSSGVFRTPPVSTLITDP